MSALEIGRPKRRLLPGVGTFLILFVILLVAGGYFILPRFEWHKPQIKITPDTDTIGLAPLEIEVAEQGSGLKSFAAVLSSGGTEYALASEEYDQPVMQKKFTVALSAKLAGLKEGPAVLRVTARDRSLWRFFRGNERASLVATDKAGNTREMRLVYELKNVKYKKSTLAISDEFIQGKVAPLLHDVGARQGSPKDIFIKVNKDLRK